MLTKEIVQTHYQGIFEDALIDKIAETGALQHFKAGDVLIDLNQYIKAMPILLEGAIKIMREDKDEGELLLYFLEQGDTCAMTMACCWGHKKSEIRAIAETDGQFIMIPIDKMESWLGDFATWRSFVFTSYDNRIQEMLQAIDNLAFNKMEERLTNYIKEISKINRSAVINKTHQEIAYELNTSRVVISRLLKSLENEGLIQLNRNTIEILKPL